jgi:hypothetical protein
MYGASIGVRMSGGNREGRRHAIALYSDVLWKICKSGMPSRRRWVVLNHLSERQIHSFSPSLS